MIISAINKLHKTNILQWSRRTSL